MRALALLILASVAVELSGVGAAEAQPTAKLYSLAEDCDSGFVEDCVELANVYLEGSDVQADPAHAAKLLQRACDRCHMVACAELGELYRQGRGVSTDVAQAARLFERSCDGGYVPVCQTRLELTAELLQDSCDAGDMTACADLKDPKNLERAAKLLEDSCDHGEMQSCVNLGLAHAKGLGVDADEARALTLFGRACDRSNAEGCRYLGLASGDPQAMKRAANLSRTACKRRDPDGCYYLATAHRRGYAVPKNEALAAKFVRRACEFGSAKACDDVLAASLDLGNAIVGSYGVQTYDPCGVEMPDLQPGESYFNVSTCDEIRYKMEGGRLVVQIPEPKKTGLEDATPQGLQSLEQMLKKTADPNVVRVVGFGRKEWKHWTEVDSDGRTGQVVRADGCGMSLLEYCTKYDLDSIAQLLRKYGAK